MAPSLPMDVGKRPKAEQDRLMNELDQKVRVSPMLFVVFAPPAEGLFSPLQFLWQLIGDVLAGLCLALLLGLANGPRAWVGRVCAEAPNDARGAASVGTAPRVIPELGRYQPALPPTL